MPEDGDDLQVNGGASLISLDEVREGPLVLARAGLGMRRHVPLEFLKGQIYSNWSIVFQAPSRVTRTCLAAWTTERRVHGHGTEVMKESGSCLGENSAAGLKIMEGGPARGVTSVSLKLRYSVCRSFFFLTVAQLHLMYTNMFCPRWDLASSYYGAVDHGRYWLCHVRLPTGIFNGRMFVNRSQLPSSWMRVLIDVHAPCIHTPSNRPPQQMLVMFIGVYMRLTDASGRLSLLLLRRHRPRRSSAEVDAASLCMVASWWLWWYPCLQLKRRQRSRLGSKDFSRYR